MEPQGISTNEASSRAKCPAVKISSAEMAVSCGGSHTALVTEDGEVYTMGWGQFGSLGLGDEADRMTPTRVSSLGCEVLLASAGGAHTATLTSVGEIWTWGEGFHLSCSALVGVPLAFCSLESFLNPESTKM